MKRLIRKADCYDWVSERADHIRDENPDMDDGMEYGIAWKQYKKDHPKWKNKKEKSKKKASRLKRIIEAEFVYCDECHWDNGDFMYNDDGTMQGWAEDLKGTKKMKSLQKDQVYKSRKEFDEKNKGTCPKCGAEDSLHLD
jgi:hypothetical protein